ncbi:MAG: hypothetical protein AAGJ46_02085 [Planctomycetota bacterium]
MTRQRCLSALLGLSLLASPAAAHFPWLVKDQSGRALLYFSESLDERDYHLPDAVREAAVFALDGGDATALDTTEVDEESLLARRSPTSVAPGAGLHTQIVYGIYHGTRLVYYAQHDPAVGPKPQPRNVDQLPFSAQLASGGEGSLAATVHWRGEPLADAEVELLDGEGEVIESAVSDAAGGVTFAAEEIPAGLAALRVGHTLADEKGEIDGKAYKSSTHYLTATFHMSDLPELPTPIASFGAAVGDGWLYVYGGHTGTAHQHSAENHSQHFRRIRLDDAATWETLPMGQPLQGLALVAHGGMVYRVGGMNARNEAGDDEDMHSSNRFARFDPAKGAWQELPPLPERRSSHDAVVIGDRLYVVGGWTLTGDSDGEWIDAAYSCDLTQPTPTWQPIAKPPFRRRAIAAAHLDGKLVVLGGMSEEAKVSGAVFAYDPETDEWASLEELPGGGISGFGVSAWNHGGALYTSGMQGVVYLLDSSTSSWQEAATMRTPRFFHRLMPAGEKKLIAVAGASPTSGHVATSEMISLDK